MLVERPASVDGHFSQQAPLVYHFGHSSPGENCNLMEIVTTKLEEVVAEKMESDKKGKTKIGKYFFL